MELIYWLFGLLALSFAWLIYLGKVTKWEAIAFLSACAMAYWAWSNDV